MKHSTQDLSKRSMLSKISDSINTSHLNFWEHTAPTAKDITITISDHCIDELDAALRRAGNIEMADTNDVSQFKHCTEFVAELHQMLGHSGPGVAIVDRLPSERYDEVDNRRLCGAFSSLVGQLMAQSFEGVTLYDVKNKNPKNPDKVRKSITNHAQPFHTDGGWHRKPAKYVGLYCVRNAQLGGGSLVTSIMGAFNAMTAFPDELELLLSFHPWDRQNEHALGSNPVENNPMFELYNSQFMARYYESYVLNGYKKANKAPPAMLDAALARLRETIAQQPSVRFEMSSGQFQYLNNWTMLHARQAFDDNEATPEDESRHVIRVWNH